MFLKFAALQISENFLGTSVVELILVKVGSLPPATTLKASPLWVLSQYLCGVFRTDII